MMVWLFLSIGTRITGLVWMFVRHPLLIFKANKKGDVILKKKKEKIPLPYTIPKFASDMKYSKSIEKYLRPVRLCNTQAQEIIATAHMLGAYQCLQMEYAEKVFEFVKNNIKTKNVPVLGAVETLKRGYGSCFDSSGLFITLCRCGGLKARYKIYLHRTPPEGIQVLTEVIDKKLLDAAAITAAFYTVTEVYIDGKWIECEVDSPPELDAYWNVPIAHFGENVSTVKGWIPNDVIYFEKIPLRLIIPTNIMMKLLKGILEGSIADVTEKEYEIGRKKLERIGKKEYDKRARRQYGFLPPLE
jgi:hypothetical protein